MAKTKIIILIFIVMLAVLMVSNYKVMPEPAKAQGLITNDLLPVNDTLSVTEFKAENKPIVEAMDIEALKNKVTPPAETPIVAEVKPIESVKLEATSEAVKPTKLETKASSDDYTNFKEMVECVNWIRDTSSKANKIYKAFLKYGKVNAIKMSCICKQESQHRNIRSYQIGANGYWDYGICQINGVHHQKVINMGYPDWANTLLNNDDVNIAVAQQVYESSGFGAWYARFVKSKGVLKYQVDFVNFENANI